MKIYGLIFAGLCAVFWPAMSMAHTSEIFFAEATVENQHNKPAANVLFLIDTSGSMCMYDNGGSKQDCSQSTSRMAYLKEAFNKVIDGLDDRINVGVGKFNGGKDSSAYGGYVFYPVKEMNETNRQEVKGAVGGLTGTSNTPLMEAYSEMARYMQGMSPTGYAKEGEAIQNTPTPAVNMRKVGSSWISDSLYESPMDANNQCESNHIIVMTDGAPTQDWDAASVNNITGGSCQTNTCVGGFNRWGQCQGEWVQESYGCQRDLAEWLYNGSNERRSVKTWQVAFGVGANSDQAQDMNSVANKGGTTAARFANNADELASQFIEILNLIEKESRSISAPGVAVNQMNRLQHLGQLYYAVFQPDSTGVWEGNLKRYGIEGSLIYDAAGNDAVDADAGFFKDTSRSFWSVGVDGAETELGGARGRLSNRKLFYSDASGTIRELTQQRIDAMSAADFGIPDGASETKESLIAKLQALWGDPLHSVPLLVNFSASGEDPDDQENYVFVSTNAGMLHAVDARTGQEEFAYMPYEMLQYAYSFANSVPLNRDNTRPLYGLDGSWTGWRRGGAGASDASAVYLYGGMRRGGRHYLAVDVSDVRAPKDLWQINAGDPGFDLLGETWSTPTLTQLRIDDQKVPVLVFGGGYDPVGHDKAVAENGMRMSAHSRVTEDVMGRAVYVVNAVTGELIWSASKAVSAGVSGAGHTRVNTMNWAVPAGISVVDIDFDGVADYFYFGDLGGQIFRVDVNDKAQSTSDIVHRVVRLGDLGGATVTQNRRFYEAPAIGYLEDKMTRQRSLVVTIGSGYAAHPLDESTEERIYAIRDETVFQSDDSSYEVPDVITNGDLLNVTSIAAPTEEMLSGTKGWYLTLSRDGEKVMASPSIFNGRLLVTTYSPAEGDQDANPCKVQLGRSYLYVMDLITSAPAALRNDGDVSDSRERQLQAQTPVSQPQIIAQDSDSLAVLIGTEVIDDAAGGNMQLRKRRWYQLPKDDANNFINIESDDTP